MQIHQISNDAEAALAEIGGEVLTGSGFENEQPDSGFAADVETVIVAHTREV